MSCLAGWGGGARRGFRWIFGEGVVCMAWHGIGLGWGVWRSGFCKGQGARGVLKWVLLYHGVDICCFCLCFVCVVTFIGLGWLALWHTTSGEGREGWMDGWISSSSSSSSSSSLLVLFAGCCLLGGGGSRREMDGMGWVAGGGGVLSCMGMPPCVLLSSIRGRGAFFFFFLVSVVGECW